MNNYYTFDDVVKSFYSGTEREILKQTVIGIAGAGGIGSNCTLLLVRSGFSRFVTADFDRVSISNLNRQQYAMQHVGRAKVECLREVCRSINPTVEIKTHAVRIDQSNAGALFSSCNVIIEAFDDPAGKALLFGTYLHSGKLLIGASGIAGTGNSSRISVRKLHEKCFIVGDETTGVSDSQKPFAPIVSLAAAKMADIVLSEVLGKRS